MFVFFTLVMYQQAIRDLSSILKGKRDKAYNYLISVVKTDPKGVVDDTG